jgi:hypothetical protein
LHLEQPLAQQHDAEQYGHQRIDEIAKRGLNCLVTRNTNYVNHPVDGNKHRGNGHPLHQVFVF